MDYKYKFTVFTPCYNSEKMLHRVYDSLMAQTIDHKQFEWIIINDCSTDGTHNLVQEYIKQADFAINYINLEKNQMVIKNYELAIQKSLGELFLAIGHDDAFVPNTMETFATLWDNFSTTQRDKCLSICCLCKNQNDNNIGNDYPIANQFVDSLETLFGWQDKGLGEQWSAIKISVLKEYFIVPSIVSEIRYIPESYFWNKIAIEYKGYSYHINDRLRVYYVNDGESLSSNIRKKYSKGFEYEALHFINSYEYLLFKYPKAYIKFLIKYILFSNYHNKSFVSSLASISGFKTKLLFGLLYVPSMLIKSKYFK